MKALYIFILTFSFSSISLFPQPYFGYNATTNYMIYEEISDGTLSTATGDDGSEIINLPFPFKFVDSIFTTARISTNGWMQLGAAYSGLGYNNNLADSTYKNFLCPLWDDLYADAQSEISFKTIGDYPARYFVVQWKNIRWKNPPAMFNRKSFQIILSEFDYAIEFSYGPSSGNDSISASIGITNNQGGMNNFISVTLNNGHGFLFMEPSNTAANNNNNKLEWFFENNQIIFYQNFRTVKLFQVPDTVYAGLQDQAIIAILHTTHPGPVLTPPWMMALHFNSYGTSNPNDIIRAKLYSTGYDPVFNNSYLLSTVENPGSSFVFSYPFNFPAYYGVSRTLYYWLAFDLSSNAQVGNIIDAACTMIESDCCPMPPAVPDTTLAGGYMIVGVPVPVELVSFTAKTEFRDVYLTWSTATESNSSHFEIERRKENEADWISAGRVGSSGTSTEIKNYSFVDKNINSGKYYYRLKAVDYDGTFEYSETVEAEVEMPDKFSLEQNYPNPFNPSTTIKYALPFDGFVAIKIYNAVGQEVTKLINGNIKAGYHEVSWNGRNSSNVSLPSGVYFYRIESGDFVNTKKMLMLK